MLGLFRTLLERVKALFLTTAALDFEAEFVTRHAERQAELLRQAARYEEEGLHGIAEHLRRQAEELDIRRPLASVLPAIAHLQDAPQEQEPAQPRLQIYPRPPSPAAASRSLAADVPKKKGK